MQFTQTFGLDATIDFKVICNPISEDIRAKYSDEVIGATLETMTEEHVVQRFETNIHEGDGFKLAGIVGRGQKGMMETMYLAQLWIGDKSAMSLQAEMSGENSEEADKMFTNILQSVYHKESHDKAAAQGEMDEDKPVDDTPLDKASPTTDADQQDSAE